MKIRADRRRARWGRAGGRMRGLLLVATVVALLTSVFAAGAFSVTATKPYKTDITPNSVAAGSSTNFTARITNEASPQLLGSANITAPTGFTATGVAVVSAPAGATATRVGNVVQLRNLSLPPGSAAIFTITATAPSTATSGTAWTVTAKQSNDFNGPPGNNFTLDPASNLAVTVLSGGGGGASRLHFFTEPADAAINTAITSTPFNSPPGTSVQVEVLDGSGHRVTSSMAPIAIAITPPTNGLLTGDNNQSDTVTKNAVAGVASFADLKINTHGSYTLIATSQGLTSEISSSITIWDSTQACTANILCTATVGDTSSFQSQFSGTSSTGGFLLLTLGQDTLSCGDTFNHAPSVTTAATFHFSATGNKTIIGDIDKSVDQAEPNNGVAFYRVCFESDDMTFTYPGGIVHPMGTPFLLPDCKAVGGTPPCVKSITKTNAGDVLETITLPPDDGFRYR
jgi:hypothetical protein